MTIQLPPQVEAIVRKKVDEGLYPSPGAALETAVQLLDEHDQRLRQLRAAIAKGEEGEAIPWSPELMDQLSREAEEIRQRGHRPDPDVCP
jgi:putative addiction module CopG family antidote